ncbi:MAG: putative membrane protein YgcG [Rhodothermales bacterium]|jgi:uncharacterized membrane protein YgcG
MRIIILIFVATPSMALAAIPNPPSMQKTLTFDGAKIISPSDRKAIHAKQLAVFKDQDVAIVVVVSISSMSRYIEGSHDIKKFAGKWFAKWRVGKE